MTIFKAYVCCNSLFIVVSSIGFQSEAQKDWLKLYGRRGVCIDSTHGTTSMGFLLTTLMVVDDYHKGLPVGFCISFSDDGESIATFLQAVYDRVGPLQPDIFMSDDAQSFWNAWTSVFGTGKSKKLLCAWHVDKNWKNQLQKKVKDRSRIPELYHGLYLLLKESSEEKFRQMAPCFLTDVEEKEPEFYRYLNDSYFTPEDRLHQWVAWRRIGNNGNRNRFYS